MPELLLFYSMTVSIFMFSVYRSNLNKHSCSNKHSLFCFFYQKKNLYVHCINLFGFLYAYLDKVALWHGVFSKRKEFAPRGANSFLLEKTSRSKFFPYRIDSY